ncbi:MAG: Uncharacterised protein [SAR116 cluster bacterium]|nr:MAG: Uncharacterised protein [SAR116 cluster bacterium]
MGFGKRPAKDSEVLRIHKYRPSRNRTITGDNTITRHLGFRHPEIMATMLDEHVPFLKGGFIQQQRDPFARCQLAFGVLCINPALSTPEARLCAFRLKFGKDIGHVTGPVK